MLRTRNVSSRTTEKNTKMYDKSVATDTKMKFVYRGVPYSGASNAMDPTLIAYLMKQKKDSERKQKEDQRELVNFMGGK